MKRCLLITLSNIGDLVMTTPVLEAINKSFPTLVVDVVGDKRSSSLLEPFPYIRHIFNKNKKADVKEQFNFLRDLRRVKYDLILDLRTAFLPFLLKGRKKFINQSNSRFNEHSVYQHFRILNKLLPKLDKPPPCKLYLPTNIRKRMATIYNLKSSNDFFVIAPGANWSKKMWPGSKYGCLIDSILKNNIVSQVILLGNTDDKKIDLGLRRINDKIIDLRGKTKLLEAACIMRQAKLFIGNDSGLGHMAAGVACKTLTLFGPGDYRRYRPWHSGGSVLIAPESNLEKLVLDKVIKEIKEVSACV